MERVVRKLSLSERGREADREVASLTADERMKLFAELLRRGEEFYPQRETAEGYPRVYRVIALRES